MSESTALANAVSAYATILAGLVALALTIWMGTQPNRWRFAYLCIFITGLATVWYHGFGEGFIPGIADIGTNLLLVWALQVATLGDFYSRKKQFQVSMASGVIILVFIVWRISVGPAGSKIFPLSFGAFGGFNVGEILLIANSFFAIGLLYANRSKISVRSHSPLYLLTAIFLAGMMFATASNSKIDFVVLAYHATWHIVGAFGFIVLWAFNHSRFNDNSI